MEDFEITLVCVDTNTGGLGYAALRRSLDCFAATHALLFSPLVPDNLDPRVTWIYQPRFTSVACYSSFILRDLGKLIATSHCLIVQWDGFVLNPDHWDDAFLDYDYIGAPWPQFAGERQVGNGGFSLRSKRLLDALRDPAVKLHGPEDLCICHTNRTFLEEVHGIRFAPVNVARHFAFERELPAHPTFGFHGLFNFPLIDDSLVRVVVSMPLALLCNRDARDLGAVLLSRSTPRRWQLCIRILCAALRYQPLAVPALLKAWFRALQNRVSAG